MKRPDAFSRSGAFVKKYKTALYLCKASFISFKGHLQTLSQCIEKGVGSLCLSDTMHFLPLDFLMDTSGRDITSRLGIILRVALRLTQNRFFHLEFPAVYCGTMNGNHGLIPTLQADHYIKRHWRLPCKQPLSCPSEHAR